MDEQVFFYLVGVWKFSKKNSERKRGWQGYIHFEVGGYVRGAAEQKTGKGNTERLVVS